MPLWRIELAQPRRIQLSRRRGWRIPPGTIIVDRRSKWGNPFRVTKKMDRAATILAFEHWLTDTVDGRELAREAREQLRGCNLACWCPLNAPCHASALLRVSNA